MLSGRGSGQTEPEMEPGDPRIKGTCPDPGPWPSGASPSSDTDLGKVGNKGSRLGALRICSEDESNHRLNIYLNPFLVTPLFFGFFYIVETTNTHSSNERSVTCVF